MLEFTFRVSKCLFYSARESRGQHRRTNCKRRCNCLKDLVTLYFMLFFIIVFFSVFLLYFISSWPLFMLFIRTLLFILICDQLGIFFKDKEDNRETMVSSLFYFTLLHPLAEEKKIIKVIN